MTRDEMEVVSALRQGLSDRIGQDRYALWFTSSVRLDRLGQELVVSTADQFLLDRLRKQFSKDLEAVAQGVLGRSPRLRFQVNTDLKSTAPVQVREQMPAAPKVDAREDEPTSESRSEPSKPRFATLDSFVVGDGNRVAVTAARSVTERPCAVTPLFLHGPTGCGKTHLLQGIWSEIRRRCRLGRALLISAEQFTTHFLEALQGSGLPSFRRKVRGVDVLVIDDLQFFSGKRATLVELQHTVDTLLRQGRQLVLAADRPPAALSGLGPELVGRVTGGLVCGIEPADFATRFGIAKQKSARNGLALSDDVLHLLASELNGDARQIAGALHRLEATSEALGRPITLDFASTTLVDIFRATRRVVHLADIERAVCDVFGLDVKTLRDGRRSKSVSQPRMLAMWLARKYTRAAFSEISHFFGRRSHSTVISAEKKVNRWVADGATIQMGHGACHVEDAIRRVETQLRTG
ncbi:MAG: DnaA ATPase domain-containing protein [Pirellulaceae bacterium]